MIDVGEVEILLVEDNPHDAEMTLRALARKHVSNRIHHVKDGVEALAFLLATGEYAGRKEQGNPKLILLDLKLPKVDGHEVLRRIRAEERTKYIPTVILTSSAEERDVVDSYKLGVNSYIVKPVDFEKFAGAVSQLGLYWVLLNRPLRSSGS